MEYGTWQENRNGNLDCLQRSGELTDVTILVEGSTFPAHRVILAAHSDYFHRMFTCGMAESRNQDIKLQDIEPEVFQEVLGYIYCGRIDSTQIDVLKGVYLAANMLQMSDLEHLTINKLGKHCNLVNCLDLYFFVDSFCDLDLHNGIYKKVKRVLYELLSEHWGEMIGQSNSNTVSDRYTQLFQDGILPSTDQLNNCPAPNSEMLKLQQDFLDLDVSSLCQIFRLKNEQEDISDFSFSFGQTDLCEGLISWVSRDLETRQAHIHTLRQFVCLHQVSGNTKKKYCKLLHEITNHDLIYSQNKEDTSIIYGQLEKDCIGLWCPQRRIPGLLLIHAWNPNDMNTLTSDHVKCHFVRPARDGEGRDEMLRLDHLYSLREMGELSEGETHWLTSNNPAPFPNGSTMMLTLDCGVVCGQVYHGLDSPAKCPHHSDRFPHFCMSDISEDNVNLKNASICASEFGYVYIVANALNPSESTAATDNNTNTAVQGETCSSFRRVEPPGTASHLKHASSACLKGNLYLFGGTSVLEGPDFGYIWCSFDLQEFHTRYSQSYKAGHSIWKTKLSSIAEEPSISSTLYIHDLSTGAWMVFPDETPFRISGGCSVWHLGKLYLIGGYTVEYDVELKSFYQNPSSTVWVFNPAKGIWSQGPSLPRTSLELQGRIISFRGYAFGQAVSHAGCIYYSGGATLAINNIFKSGDTAPLNKYEYVSFSKVLRLEPNMEEWKTIFNPSPDHTQDYTLYGAIPSSVNLKKIKVKNGRLVSSQLSSDDNFIRV